MAARTMRTSVRAGEAIALAAALIAGLAGCAQEPPQLPPGNRPTMAPEQSAGEACAISQEEVATMISGLQARIGQAGESLTTGRAPDLTGIASELQGSLKRISAQVSNSEVRAALAAVETELQAFDSITPPDSIVGMPGYLGSLGSQLTRLQDAGTRLQSLCSDG